MVNALWLMRVADGEGGCSLIIAVALGDWELPIKLKYVQLVINKLLYVSWGFAYLRAPRLGLLSLAKHISEQIISVTFLDKIFSTDDALYWTSCVCITLKPTYLRTRRAPTMIFAQKLTYTDIGLAEYMVLLLTDIPSPDMKSADDTFPPSFLLSSTRMVLSLEISAMLRVWTPPLAAELFIIMMAVFSDVFSSSISFICLGDAF